jgi:hypothetical protein
MADEKLPALLQRTTKQLKVEIEGVLIEADIALLKESLASEVEVKTIHNNTLLVVDEKENTKSKVLHWVGAGQYNLIQMQTETAGLEKIFQQLTQQTEK